MGEPRVRDFGPLIVSIDTHGDNLFEQQRARFDRYEARREQVLAELRTKVGFIK